MAASYPGAVKSFTAVVDGVDYLQATHVNSVYDEVAAIEGALLTTGLAHNVIPATTALYDLGTSGLKWRDAFLSRDLAVGRNATIGGTITLNGRTYTFPASETATAFLQTDGAGTLSWTLGTSAMTLLKANSGTDTSAAATNVDTVAISGLTAKDRIKVYYSLDESTQQVAAVTLRNNTDAVTIGQLSGGVAIAAGVKVSNEALVQQLQPAATSVVCTVPSTPDSSGATVNAAATYSTFVTNWTGSWTLALRHGGVTAGGTFRWAWAVYKIAGQ